MKFLIIGSNSFSGFNFIKLLLQKNHKVIAISRSNLNNKAFHEKNIISDNNFKFYKLDLNKNYPKILNLIKKNNISIIYNFAAQSMVPQSWKNPLDWYQTNIISQVKLVEDLKKLKTLKKYVNFSTPEVYGSTSKWINENYKFNPSTPYAISRAAFDNHLLALYKNFNFPVIFTRASNVYGPGQKLYRIIPFTILSAINKSKINLIGGGTSERSFIHINDVSEALYKIYQKGKIGETYHISTNRIISIYNLVKIISKKMNVKLSSLIKIKKENLGKDFAYKLNSNKIRRKLKWIPKISLESGIDDVINWTKINKNVLNRLPKKYIHKK